MKATSFGRTGFWCTAALLLCSLGAPAAAETVTFQFTGTIDGGGPGPTTFSGTYSFDSGEPDQEPDGGIGRYALQSFTLNAGFVVIEPPTSEVYVENDARGFFPHDRYSVTANGTTPTGIVVNTIEFNLIDEVSALLSSDALPTTPPDLEQASNNSFSADVEMPDGSPLTVSGVIDSLTLVAPPMCSADISGDGVVDAADLAGLLGSWGPCVGDFCPADLDQDDDVDAADLAALLGAWGPCEEE